jgi:hypothetical protein
MKKILIPITTLLMALPFVTNAQDPGLSGSILNKLQDGKDARQANVQERKNLLQQNMDSRQEQINIKKETFEQNMELRKNTLEEKSLEIQQRLEERKIKIEEKRVKLENNRKLKIENILENIYTKLNNMILKLNGIADKIEAKIIILNESGKDTGNANTLLNEARNKIELAVSDLEASKTTLGTVLESEVSKGDIRLVVDTIKDSIKIAHTSLIGVIKELKNTKETISGQ